MGSVGKPWACVIQPARRPGCVNSLRPALSALYFIACLFLCKEHGGICLQRFLVFLGKRLFAQLHKISEARLPLCPLDGEGEKGVG